MVNWWFGIHGAVWEESRQGKVSDPGSFRVHNIGHVGMVIVRCLNEFFICNSQNLTDLRWIPKCNLEY